MANGYYRFPTIHDEGVVFVSEDDLWTVPAGGGVARRLTSGLAQAAFPCLSPDGSLLAFTGREEGQSEVYVMPAEGGPARRLTFMGGLQCRPVNWTQDGRIVFADSARFPFVRVAELFTIAVEGGEPERLNVGPAQAITYGPDGQVVLGRNIGSPARWKRYRGGTAGQLWIDRTGSGQYEPLIELKGNLADPMWVASRVYFLSDHEGIGNLYSCLPDGSDLRRHTDHDDFYARNASTDGRRIVYHAGADLYIFDLAGDAGRRIAVDYHSPLTQRNRKFVDADAYLDSWKLHPEGHSLAITSRGKAFTMANWEGAVMQHGRADGPRYRLLTWLNDGRRLVAVSDADGEEAFVILPVDGLDEPRQLSVVDFGRPVDLKVNPRKDTILFSNHRYELCHLDLESEELTVIDRGRNAHVNGLRLVAGRRVGRLRGFGEPAEVGPEAVRAATGEITQITEPVLHDLRPSFDPDGRYLYFISHRVFDPVYDNLHFDLGFPRGALPHLIVLSSEERSPFASKEPKPPKDEKKAEPDKDEEDSPSEKSAGEDSPHAPDGAAPGPQATPVEGEEPPPDHPEGNDTEEGEKDVPEDERDKEKPVRIDLEGITRRIVAFPVDDSIYGRIYGIKEGRVIYSRFPVEGALNQPFWSVVPPAKAELLIYDLDKREEETLVETISGFALSRDRGTMVYRAGYRLRVLKAGAKPPKGDNSPGRKSGWVDLRRIKISVVPELEWRQMLRETWRLQRDHFWTPDMSKVDWVAVYERYLPLVERVASRAEFSDLVWEMQGELGTSHAYEIGGDYRPEPSYEQGYLGAEFAYDSGREAWRISRIVQGDPWDEKGDSPANAPGVALSVGDLLLAVNGRRLGRDLGPSEALVNLAGQEITLTVQREGKEKPELVTVRALASEVKARYREWVEGNRKLVHELTGGRIGYVHIPDMGPGGYAEFHRGYLAEVDRDGLLVDVRFNSGGHVSQLLLEKLQRKPIGYGAARWSEDPESYPAEAVRGPMVALTNEYAGSDGDIFSHGFKLLGLGPLLGKRTWGGVIGINPRHRLADNTITTQPEFSFWFQDVGWGVENYGTDPDIEVDNRPQDYAADRDTQLLRAVEEIQRLLAESPPAKPDLADRPSLALPKLPPR
jgi:tricorn protease